MWTLFTRPGGYWRTPIDPPPNLALKVYKGLWLLGLAGAVLAYVDLSAEPKLLGLTNVFGHDLGFMAVVVLAFVTILQQWSVYNELEQVEKDPSKVKEEYPDWTNTRLERILRLFIMLALLLGVGKIADVIDPLMQKIADLLMQHDIVDLHNFLIPHDQSLFVLGSLFVFVLLVIWNLFALDRRRKIARQEPEKFSSDHNIICARILLFIVISSMAAFYWF